MMWTCAPVCFLYFEAPPSPSEVPSIPAIPLPFILMTRWYRQLCPSSYPTRASVPVRSYASLLHYSPALLPLFSPLFPPHLLCNDTKDSKYYAQMTQLTFQLPIRSRNLNPSLHISCTVVIYIHIDQEVSCGV